MCYRLRQIAEFFPIKYYTDGFSILQEQLAIVHRFVKSETEYSYLPPAAHFSQQLEKWTKEPEETDGFFTSLRAMHCAKLQLHPARLRELFFFVFLSNRLCSIAAAADACAEQRFGFYR